MRVRLGFYFAVVGLVILINTERLKAINQKTNPLHKTLKITSERHKSDSRLTTDLNKSLNTFKRKDHISQKKKKSTGKASHELENSTNGTETSERNVKRQYIYSVPAMLSSSSLIPRRLVAYPNPGLHRVCSPRIRNPVFTIRAADSLESGFRRPTNGIAFSEPTTLRLDKKFRFCKEEMFMFRKPHSLELNSGCAGTCLHHVCYHGGACVRTRHGFYCDCPEQYIGAHCEFKRACLDNPCKNAGTCTELGQGDYTCTCLVGSKGKSCELKDSCVPNPCDNKAICTELDDGYHCTCMLGYKGDRCQKKALCYPNPCKNGATCIDRDDREFKCSCALGFKGDLCEVFSECKNAPCVNGGTCIEMAVGYRCACLNGFVGKNCQVTLCNPNPCANDGKCSVIGDHYNCACPKHYIGKHCEALNPCRTNPCLNGGECAVSPSTSGYSSDGFSCKCPRGYYGNMCQMK